jgi:serine/threonine-protein kinase
MAIASATELLDVVCKHQLLDDRQSQEAARLAADFPEPRDWARQLIQRGWLTAWQIRQLGKGRDLVIGDYLLLEMVGEGGMGQVFKARHRRLQRLTALKVIRHDYLQSPSAVERFHREARAAARLSHPNIVTVYDAGEVNGTHYLAMEFLEGQTLASVLKNQGRLPIGLACEYIRQAAIALQHAHQQGLVHRDIKPSNLMLCNPRPGSPAAGSIKVMDMGLARLNPTLGEGPATGLTEENAVMGTPDYIAPEQAMNASSVDIRADIYSLGCTLYHLLTGQPPFPGGSMANKLAWHMAAEPQQVEQLRPELPPNLAAILRGMMAKRPEHRYQTPAEVAAALEPFCIHEESIQPMPISRSGVGGRDPYAETLTTPRPGSLTSDQPVTAASAGKLLLAGCVLTFAALVSLAGLAALAVVFWPKLNIPVSTATSPDTQVAATTVSPTVAKETKTEVPVETKKAQTKREPPPPQPPPPGQPATVRIQVPADAILDFDGHKTMQVGPERVLVTPPLTPGKRYTYRIKASWQDAGKPVVREETVSLEAGQTIRLDWRPVVVVPPLPRTGNCVVVIDTSMGRIRIELFENQAPVTVTNFLAYVDDGFYDGTIFHRVIPNFLIQAGGFQPGMQAKNTRGPIRNESQNGLSNRRGTVAMARAPEPQSATSHFYINVKDNPDLDRINAKDGFGWCVFGQVIEGMDVVDRITTVPTGPRGALQNVPLDDLVIRAIRREN